MEKREELQEIIISPVHTVLLDFGEIWRYRELFYFFTWRDVKIKYKQTVLGFAWVVLQPLLMMAIFTFFFGRALAIPSQNLPYTVYVFSGLLIWNLFAAGLTGASNSMVNNSAIIKKIYFPRLIIPVSAILAASFDFIMAFLLFVVILMWYHQPVAWLAIFTWPLSILLTIMSTLGIGSWLSALNVKYRDFRYVIPFLIQGLFFVTPIIYPVSMLKYPVLQYIISFSPVYAAIELFRFPLTGMAPNATLMTVSLASTVFFLLIGVWYFKRTEEFFADLA